MKGKGIKIGIGILILALGIQVLIQGGERILQEWKLETIDGIGNLVGKTFLPELYFQFQRGDDSLSFLEKQLCQLFPLHCYAVSKEMVTAVEDEVTYQMILEQQAKDEERMSEDLVQESASQEVQPVVQSQVSLESLRDFNSLLSTYYTVDSTTMIGPEQLNVDDLMSRDMHINQEVKGPKVLIFHTHSQEAFADSTAGDSSTSIVGMGAYLSELLNGKGIETIHHDGVYDLVGGQLDRSKAYELSEIGVKEILNAFPSIEVVIDLHRDGVPEDRHLVTEIDGKQTAKIMFFNGLSRTRTNGDIAYLKNPYIQENLSFSFQMQLAANNMYPGFARRIYLKGYRYSLHMMPKSLLIEAGAQTNTVSEMRHAMEALANVLEHVLIE